jgi:hypothetical protein
MLLNEMKMGNLTALIARSAPRARADIPNVLGFDKLAKGARKRVGL